MKFILKLIFFVIFVIFFVIVIFYGRGYRFDLGKKTLKSTGILALTSSPSSAKIFINGEFKGVSDTNLIYPPGKYKIEIKKDGFTSWTKEVVLKGELVVNLEATLFPVNPSLSPLTNIGVVKAFNLSDNNKIIILGEDGIYLFEANKNQLPFFTPLKLLLAKENFNQEMNLNEIKEIIASPDLKQAIFISEKEDFLLSLEEENKKATTLDLISKNNLIEAWENKKTAYLNKILETYPKDFVKIASDSIKIISFSPNENKLLYQALDNFDLPIIIKPPLIGTNQTKEERSIKKNLFYVYDKKEDKNYLINDIQDEKQVQWYFDSKHLVLNEKKKLIIKEYDDQNKQTVYSGPYEDYFFMTTNDGKIIVLLNLNPENNQYGDLYLVGIR